MAELAGRVPYFMMFLINTNINLLSLFVCLRVESANSNHSESVYIHTYMFRKATVCRMLSYRSILSILL